MPEPYRASRAWPETSVPEHAHDQLTPGIQMQGGMITDTDDFLVMPLPTMTRRLRISLPSGWIAQCTTTPFIDVTVDSGQQRVRATSAS